MPDPGPSWRRRDQLTYGAIWLLGKSLALLPTACPALLCRGLGAIMYRFSPRRHTILSGLARAFPERDAAWRERIARLNCSRMFEMFLLILVLPHWSERTARQRFRASEALERFFTERPADRPVLLASPHSVLMEAQALIPLLCPQAPLITTLYRALELPAAELYVRRARDRWGARFVARRDGLLKAKRELAVEKAAVGLLFDQSAGHRGHLTLFFDRTCSTSNLTGLLAAKARATPLFVYTRREGFWRGVIECRELPVMADPIELVVRLGEELETHLRTDEEACVNWFWAHQRWKGPQRAHQVLSFRRRKSYLAEQLRLSGRAELPRRTHLAVRLDPRPALLPTAERLIRLLREERPDVRIWLLVPEELAADELPPVDRRWTLPPDSRQRRAELRRIDAHFVDLLFCLDPSTQAVRENRRLHTEFSTGPVLPGVRHRYRAAFRVEAEDYAQDAWAAWEAFLPQLGLKADAAEEPA